VLHAANDYLGLEPGSAATIEKALRCHAGIRKMEEISMRKTLAVLATVAAVAATTMTASAPAEARGFGPGLAFGVAAGALAAGAAGAYTATVPVTTGTGRRITDPDMGLTPITAVDRITATATGAIAGN
jgi:hypothetical protein